MLSLLFLVRNFKKLNPKNFQFKVEMIGTTIMDHLHPGDIPKIQFNLAIGFDQANISIDNPEVRFTSRWRCSLAKRNAGIITGGYKVSPNLRKNDRSVDVLLYDSSDLPRSYENHFYNEME